MKTRLINLQALFAFLFITGTLQAQGVIIDRNKAEIKTKITEIPDPTITYKKWEMQGVRNYNRNKNDSFMITYSQGHREVITQEPDASMSTLNSQNNTESDLASVINKNTRPAPPKADTTIEYRDKKVKYTPFRVYTQLKSPLSINGNSEIRIIKNTINLGIAAGYEFTKREEILGVQTSFIYAGYYAPINRLTANFEKQNKGLFLFAHLGYGLRSTRIKIVEEDMDDTMEVINTYDFTWRLGADYMFFEHFGITLLSHKFETLQAGIVVSFK